MVRKLKADDIPRVSDSQSASLYYRRLVDELVRGNLSRATVVLEFMSSLVGVSDGNSEELDPQGLIDSFPVRTVRENTVPVPVEMLRVLIEPWQEYKKEDGAYSYSQQLGIDRKGQGKTSTAKRLAKINRDVGLNNKVVVELVERPDDSLESIFETVAKAERVSSKTVKNAYSKHYPKFLEYVDWLGKNIEK